MAGTGSSPPIWLSKSLSILEKFTARFTAQPPPLLPTSSPPNHQQQQQPDINESQPIIQVMREQELGRVIITVAIPVATEVLISGNGKLQLPVAYVMVVGLMVGCMVIWNGILFRTNFPRLANVFEQVGISLVLISLYGLVASFLPKGVSWILWISGLLCLAPFILSPIIRKTAIWSS